MEFPLCFFNSSTDFTENHYWRILVICVSLFLFLSVFNVLLRTLLVIQYKIHLPHSCCNVIVTICNARFNFLKHSLCGVVFAPKSVLVAVYRVSTIFFPSVSPALFLFCI
jgi:hypothetical protein